MTFRELLTQEIMGQLQINEATAAALVAGDIGATDADMPLTAEMENVIRQYLAVHRSDTLASLNRGFAAGATAHSKRLLKKNRSRGR